MIKVSNIKKKFDEVRALQDCSFVVTPQTISALIGPNGAGKTTMFDVISGFTIADSGEVHLGRQVITGFAPQTIARLGVSRVFQHSRLFENLTVKDNLIVAIEAEAENLWLSLFFNRKDQSGVSKTIEETLSFVGMDMHLNKLVKNLSFGQKRLVELARALILPHKILLLDEPITALSPNLRTQIAQILLKLKKEGETILFIEHDMDFMASIADQVIVLNEGKVIAQGTVSQIREHPEVISSYLVR